MDICLLLADLDDSTNLTTSTRGGIAAKSLTCGVLTVFVIGVMLRSLSSAFP